MNAPRRVAAPSATPRVPIALAVAVLLAGCTSEAGDEIQRGASAGADAEALGNRGGMSAVPEANSLLGGALYTLPLDSAREARMVAQLDSAEAVLEANPDSAIAHIWVGRRLAYLGRYRDAIEVFSDAIERFPDDARLYRHRGHRYITVRAFDRAVADLEHAARLISGSADRVEPDGQPNAAGIPRSTLHTNIWYHLALARFLQGDFEGAVHGFRTGLDASPNDDMRVAMADWLWMALRRLGRDEEASALLERFGPEMDVIENDAYHRRLLMYKGELSPDSLAPALSGPAAWRERKGEAMTDEERLQLATYGFGLGHWHLLRGDEPRARAIFRRVIDTGYWPAFGYIAAAAELQRLGTRGPG